MQEREFIPIAYSLFKDIPLGRKAMPFGNHRWFVSRIYYTPEEAYKLVEKDRYVSGGFLWRGLVGFKHYVAINEVRTVGRRTVMSDTPMEMRTNQEFINNANGRVLIFGLGIGLIILPLLKDPRDISQILVVEYDQRIIDFIEPRIRAWMDENGVPHSLLKIEQGDAWEWHKTSGKQKFDTIYFDIWPSISYENYEDMKTLHKLYRKNYVTKAKNPNAFINSWVRDECKAMYNGKELTNSYASWMLVGKKDAILDTHGFLVRNPDEEFFGYKKHDQARIKVWDEEKQEAVFKDKPSGILCRGKEFEQKMVAA